MRKRKIKAKTPEDPALSRDPSSSRGLCSSSRGASPTFRAASPSTLNMMANHDEGKVVDTVVQAPQAAAEPVASSSNTGDVECSASSECSQNKKTVSDASTSADNPEDQVPKPREQDTEDQESCDFKIPDYETFEYDSESEPREPDSTNAYGPTPQSIFQNEPETHQDPACDADSQHYCQECGSFDYNRYYNPYEVATEQNIAQALPVYLPAGPEAGNFQYVNQVPYRPAEWQQPAVYGYRAGWSDEAAALPPPQQQVRWAERITEADELARAMQASLTITEIIEPTAEQQGDADAQNLQLIPRANVAQPSGNRRNQILLIPGSYFIHQPYEDGSNQHAFIPGAYMVAPSSNDESNQLAEWQWTYPSEPS